MHETYTYSNPILTGFFPDPSIVRVDEDYYVVNSTFEYFPGVVISHSRDLVHWEIIGHAFARSDMLDLTDIDDSCGLWAPDISYYQGKFYIMVTLRLNGSLKDKAVHRQLVVTSKKPAGPYSTPTFINLGTIDPSHFVDDDGAHYMVISPGVRLVRLTDDCSRALGEPEIIWSGTGERCPEGPHLLKKDGYYYAILAEGGTGYGHQINVARSTNLFGPYEPSPYNPVLIQRDPNAIIQRTGHGKLIQTQKGDWWMVYLCGRQNDGPYTTLGRETALDPVEWTDDGWFLVNSGKGPSEVQSIPDLPEVIYEERYFDNFDSGKLNLTWEFLRNPENERWSLTDRPGYFRILAGNGILGTKQIRNVLLRREKHFTYRADIRLEFVPGFPGEEAGLVCYHGMYCFIKLFLTYKDGFKIQAIQHRNNEITVLGSASVPPGPVYLKICVDHQLREFYYSIDNASWILVGRVTDASFLSNEGVLLGKHHTGTLIGIYATNGGSGHPVPADFDWFRYSFNRERNEE